MSEFAHRTYGPDAVGVIGRRAVASLRDAYVLESIHPQGSNLRGLVNALHIAFTIGHRGFLK